MDASALDKALSTLSKVIVTLERSSESLEWWLRICIALVVLGLAIEIIVVFVGYWEKYSAFVRAWIRSPEKPGAGMLILELLGTVLITVGVAGEFAINIRAGKVNSDLRTANKKVVALLNEEAGDARDRAANADLRSTQLLAQIQPRDLSSKQQREIGNRLRQFSTHRQLVVLSFMGDAESFRLCDQILASLRYGKLSPMDLCSSNPVPPKYHPVFGIQVGGPPVERAMVEAIAESFRSIGKLDNLDVHTDLISSSGSIVTVGLKPLPPLEASPRPVTPATRLPASSR
jgi:hypothetical protein